MSVTSTACTRAVVMNLFTRIAAAILGIFVCSLSVASPAAAGEDDPRGHRVYRPFTQAGAAPGVVMARFEQRELDHLRADHRPALIADFPLTAARTVDLAVRPFSNVYERTVFVAGGADRADIPIHIEPGRYTFLRGVVPGVSGSRVFIALSPTQATGTIDLGPGEPTFMLSSVAPGGEILPRGVLSVFRGLNTGATLPPGVELCGVDGRGEPGPETARAVEPIHGLRVLDLAIETDFEYFELFDDVEAAIDYIVLLYGAVSDIFMRDVNTRIDLSFVRIWTEPGGLPFHSGPNPLGAFRSWWTGNMGHVHRDVAQYFSGRRDLSFGGTAYLSSLCMPSGYSWAGYALGFFATPDTPHTFNRDIFLTAHELGHNFASLHTHQYGIDDCHLNTPTPTRGTIMSYCSQTVSGAAAAMDLRFCTVTAGVMRDFVATRQCMVFDCNRNGVDDAVDIATGFSADENDNGIPDECEDCNNNGVLDPEDIESGFSLDLNHNGIPDECEPDCNGTGRPDDLDIADGVSQDLNLNGIPDECEPDCNGSGVPDFVEIYADMSLDVSRTGFLDECEDCSGDGVPDLVALDGSHNMWIAGQADGSVREFYGLTGVLMNMGQAVVEEPMDVVITPDRRVLVSSGAEHRVAVFNRHGDFLGDLVAPGSGGLNAAAGMAVSPEGSGLLVVSSGNDSVLRFDAHSGEFLGEFVPAGTGGLTEPFGVAYSPRGTVVVTSGDNRVLEFDGATGQYLGDLVGADPGTLSTARGVAFKPDGNLLVASFGSDELLEYDGETGEFLGRFNKGGAGNALLLRDPWGVRIGPDGDVYVSINHVHRSGGGGRLHVTTSRVFHFDVRTGNYLRAFIVGHDTGLFQPAGFDFMPDAGTDCNVSFLPDECDIALGLSNDANGNGVPDECECLADWNSDGVVGSADLVAFLADWSAGSADYNFDGVTDSTDLLLFLAAWAEGCPDD